MINSRSLDALHPTVGKVAGWFVLAAKETFPADYIIVVTSTYRDNEYQKKIYDQGRTTPGPIVTNAKPGSSFHNWQCAFDLAIIKDHKILGTRGEDLKMWKKLGLLGQEYGFVWGGDWNGDGIADKNDWDFGHFQYTGGLTLEDFKNGKTLPN